MATGRSAVLVVHTCWMKTILSLPVQRPVTEDYETTSASSLEHLIHSSDTTDVAASPQILPWRGEGGTEAQTVVRA